VEKPLALTVSEGTEIKKSVETNKVKLSVVHNYKFLHPFIKAKRMQESGQIGRLLSIYTAVYGSSPPAWDSWKLDKNKAGSMILQWNHPLYLHTWFAGTPKSVFAVGKQIIPDYPSIADLRVLIDFGECTGYIEMSEFCSCPRFSFGITGTGASLVLQPSSFRVLTPSASIEAVDAVFASFSNLGKVFRTYLEMQQKPYMRYTWGSHFRLIKAFVESIRNDEKVPADVDEGILSITLANAIEESMRSGQKITI
jgi:predicted dehydrogenase